MNDGSGQTDIVFSLEARVLDGWQTVKETSWMTAAVGLGSSLSCELAADVRVVAEGRVLGGWRGGAWVGRSQVR